MTLHRQGLVGILVSENLIIALYEIERLFVIIANLIRTNLNSTHREIAATGNQFTKRLDITLQSIRKAQCKICVGTIISI